MNNIWDKLRKLAGITDENSKEFPLTHVGTSSRPATRRATTSPGHVRHRISHRPNPIKKMTKPLVAGIPRTVGLRFRHRWPAPTQDAIRRAERSIGVRLIVVNGRVSSRDGDDHGLDWDAINLAIPGTAKRHDMPSPGLG